MWVFLFLPPCVARLEDLSFLTKELNPRPLQWKCRVLTNETPGKSPQRFKSLKKVSSINLLILPRDILGYTSELQCGQLNDQNDQI